MGDALVFTIRLLETTGLRVMKKHYCNIDDIPVTTNGETSA